MMPVSATDSAAMGRGRIWVQLHVSPEINALLEKALAISVQQEVFFVGVEHLFSALLEESGGLPARIRDQHLNALFNAAREVNRSAWRGPLQAANGEIFHTPRCIAAINQAQRIADRLRCGPAGPGHLLLAILSDGLSAPSRAMDQLGLDRKGCIESLRTHLGEPRASRAALSVGTSAAAPAVEQIHPAAKTMTAAQTTADAHPVATPALPTLTRDLTEAARSGHLEPAIGRDAEIFEILQILTRKNKNNAMIVGDAGVGKTQVVEGLAYRLAQDGAIPGAPPFRILELNLAALMAGTQYRGAFEEKMSGLLAQLKQSPDCVLFIDEAHLIMGAGATDGDSMDMANLLKPALARGEIRCIGATTLQEYRKFVEKDPATERRFQMVRIEELSEAATREVLRRLRPSLERHHGVRISGRALEAAVTLTQRYMPNRHLPDKAIDMVDQACARYRLKKMATRDNPALLDRTIPACPDNKVTPHDIRKVISQATAIPIETMTAEERLMLVDLERRIKNEIIGQDEAVARAVAMVKRSRAGLSDPNRPEAVMLFLGPSGVGKTQMAKVLARHLFGSSNHLISFDMSEYVEEHSVSRLLGAPPGYAGCDEEGRLSAAVRSTPFSILLFDEVEKAHPRIFDIFLPIFDEGRLKDARGREVSFRNCIIILTSNIGANLLYRADSGGMSAALMAALRGHFRPELINRIDEIVPFYPLLAEDVRSILRLEINRIRERLWEKRLGIRMYQQAYEYLAAKGYSEEYGARELRRVVEKMVATPISEMILDGAFSVRDMIDVLIEDGELHFRKGRPRHEDREKAV